MHVHKVHVLEIAATATTVGALLDELGDNGGRLWPSDRWPTAPMGFDRGLEPGSSGGHGAIRYVVDTYVPGRSVVFRFTPDMPLDGVHRLDVEPLGPTRTRLTHTLDVTAASRMRLLAPVLLGSHNAIVEDLLARAHHAATGEPLSYPRLPRWLRCLNAAETWWERRRPAARRARLTRLSRERNDQIMDVAIIGAGRLGRAVQHALHQRQATSRLYSRWSGFDVLAPDSGHDLGGADVVVEATDVSTQRADVAADFFSRSTRSVAAAVREAGASRHILVSIVHCDRPELQGNGYYAGKAIQERVAREESPTLTLVRSTTWYEFAAQNVERFSRGPFALVPTMTVRPVALAAVAGVVAECALEERARDREVAGPEVTTLWRMTRALSNRPAVLVPFPVPGTAGRAMRGGALLPGPDVEVIGPRFADWLRAPVDR